MGAKRALYLFSYMEFAFCVTRGQSISKMMGRWRIQAVQTALMPHLRGQSYVLVQTKVLAPRFFPKGLAISDYRGYGEILSSD
jgi:hypothetical protein